MCNNIIEHVVYDINNMTNCLIIVKSEKSNYFLNYFQKNNDFNFCYTNNCV